MGEFRRSRWEGAGDRTSHQCIKSKAELCSFKNSCQHPRGQALAPAASAGSWKKAVWERELLIALPRFLH